MLHETLTDRALYQGDTVAEILAAVMTKAPALETLPAHRPREGVRHRSGSSGPARLPVVFKAAVELTAAQSQDGVDTM